jgi:hypothetical protein
LLAGCAQKSTPVASQSWAYSSAVDSISNVAAYTGCRSSSNAALTDAGQSQADLCFQQAGDSTIGWVELKQGGAFQCATWPATCQIAVRLDNGAPFQLAMTQKPNAPGRLYIVGLRLLLSRIAGTEHLLVETPVDARPAQDLGFSLDGLDFNQLHFPAGAFQAPEPIQASTGSAGPSGPAAAGSAAAVAAGSAKAAPVDASQALPDESASAPKEIRASAHRAKPAQAPAAPEDQMGRDPEDHTPGAG